MNLSAIYSHKNGKEIITEKFDKELQEIVEVIEAVDAKKCFNKISKEKTMTGRTLYSPRCLNKLFKEEFIKRGWSTKSVNCEYSQEYYQGGYTPLSFAKNAYREMDFIKNKVGVEVQFGKYAFMVYNVSAKMTIFKNLGFIDVGVEIVPVLEFQKQMSTGVSYFEQVVWDLKQRGVADIDIPVLILGVGVKGKQSKLTMY